MHNRKLLTVHRSRLTVDVERSAPARRTARVSPVVALSQQ
jgi:hypothetical protein